MRRTAITACRGSLQTLHNAANIVSLFDQEAARMLRTAEGMARAAVSRLEFLGRQLANTKKGKEKDRADTDAPMGPTAVAAAAAPKPRRRGRRGARAAAPPLAAAEPVRGPDVEAAGAQLASPRERSPRRAPAPTPSSATPPSREPGGFRAGQTVCLCGLAARPELNGCLATVGSFDKVAGRFAVQVCSTSENFKVKPENIKLTIFGAGGRQIPAST